MRRYDDPVDVRKGMVDGSEGPEQFLWRGRLWKVQAVLAHWVETGAWWESTGTGVLTVLPDLTAEREVWRVQASRGRLDVEDGGGGVFDLLLDWSAGSWRLVRCLD
jgi:hypothetical protein